MPIEAQQLNAQPTIYQGSVAYARKNADGSIDYYDKENNYIGHEEASTQRQNLERLKATSGFGKSTNLRGEESYSVPTPEGGMASLSESGGVNSITLPAHYTNEYSSYDQKQIEKLYRDRSQAATDPELTAEERQLALDKIDAMISKVPRLSPIMKEPTAQEKFNASIVTDPVTGRKGTINKNGVFEPLEDDKVRQAQQDKYDQTVQKFLSQMISDDKDGKIPLDIKIRRAKQVADNIYNTSKAPSPGIIPKLNDLWITQMNKIDYGGLFNKKGDKLTYRQMKDVRALYTKAAIEKYGMTEEEALFDFMLRLQEAQNNPDDPFNKILPKLTDEQEKEYSRVIADKVKANSVHIKDMPDDLLVPWSISKPENNKEKIPTPEELKAIGTEEAYNKGVELGYWE